MFKNISVIVSAFLFLFNYANAANEQANLASQKDSVEYNDILGRITKVLAEQELHAQTSESLLEIQKIREDFNGACGTSAAGWLFVDSVNLPESGDSIKVDFTCKGLDSSQSGAFRFYFKKVKTSSLAYNVESENLIHCADIKGEAEPTPPRETKNPFGLKQAATASLALSGSYFVAGEAGKKLYAGRVDRQLHANHEAAWTVLASAFCQYVLNMSKSDSIKWGASFAISLGILEEIKDQSRYRGAPGTMDDSRKDLVADAVGVLIGALFVHFTF